MQIMSEQEFRAASSESFLRFPEGFLWGVSTAAHQVEGGNCNQWSEWEQAGRIKSGDSCGKACDWWENAERDFDIARDLGLTALRLSFEWSRIEPEENRFDAQVLDRYRQMLEGLHRRGIEPVVCLHHFTHPCWFEKSGAFLRPDAPFLFERFARKVAEAVGDLVRVWVTFNEPNVYAACGYVLGEFPPGRKGELLNALRVNTLQAQAHVGQRRHGAVTLRDVLDPQDVVGRRRRCRHVAGFRCAHLAASVGRVGLGIIWTAIGPRSAAG